MSLVNMQNNKSPGHDGLTKEFSCHTAKYKKELSISKRQAIMILM